MKPLIGIIGNGHVGSALERGLRRAGYEVRAVGHDERAVRECGESAEIIVLAVPFSQIDATLGELGDAIDDKTIVDVTNAIGPNMQLALGYTTSGAEELQKKAPRAHVVKAFNTVFASHMDNGKVDGESLSAFVAGDDAHAKEQTIELAGDIGFDPVDAGPLANARWIEALAYLNIQLGYVQHMGQDIGFKLVHPSHSTP